jgi:chemotaxis protein CheY-P-specific phosphatase CheC
MTDVRSAIATTSTRILTDWAMMMVDPEILRRELFDWDQPFHVAEAQFEGIICGSFYVVCQSAFAETLASNLLGDDQGHLEVQDDALREMVNVFAGNLLTDAFGTDTVFGISPPTSSPEGNIATIEKILDPTRSFAFRADGQPVVISFSISL